MLRENQQLFLYQVIHIYSESFLESLKLVLITMVRILMTSEKLAFLGFLEIKVILKQIL